MAGGAMWARQLLTRRFSPWDNQTMTSARKRILSAALALVSSAAHAGYGRCELRTVPYPGLYLPAFCTQLDPSNPGRLPDFLSMFGEDSRQWTQSQRRQFYDCACQDYDEVAARYAAFGLDLDRAAISVRSGPSDGSEVLEAIHAEFDAAISQIGGTPYYTSPWVFAGTSLLENRRHDPSLRALFTELSEEPVVPSPFTPSHDGYSRMPGITNVSNIEPLFPLRVADLRDVDLGLVTPDPASRLGAYAATRGFPPGTVGFAVHNAIGDIYMLLGTLGQEEIGLVFNNAVARQLFSQSVWSEANRAMATMEYEYWSAVLRSNPDSFGGRAGAAFTPDMRVWLQANVYSAGTPLRRAGPQAPPPPPVPGGPPRP